MVRWPLFLLLSLAAHLAASWLLREPMQPLAGQFSDEPQVLRIAAIQLQAAVKDQPQVPPSESVPEPKPAVAPAQPAPAAKPTVNPPIAPMPVAARPIAKTNARPVVEPTPKPTVAPAQPAEPPALAASTAKPTAKPTPPAVSAVAALAAQPREPVEVVSREPSFRQPPKPPRYPSTARRRNQEGTVLVEVRLDRHGAQRDVQVLRSSGVSSLDQAAVKAVSGWRFKPETVAGQPVPSRVQIPIAFALAARR